MAAPTLKVPAGGGGLVRYFDEYKSKVQIKPEALIIAIILVIIFEILLRVIKF